MLKFNNAVVTFSEVPEEVTLCFEITGCPIHCPDCHSKHLWEDIGDELKPVVLSSIIAKNPGITCVAFMGGDNSPEDIYTLAKWVKNNTELKVCWYSGTKLKDDFSKHMEYFDFIKTGPYKKELGGLDSVTTNQRFYQVKYREVKAIGGGIIESYHYLEDITNKFWKDAGNNKNNQG